VEACECGCDETYKVILEASCLSAFVVVGDLAAILR
jgi:hypothetical protein